MSGRLSAWMRAFERACVDVCMRECVRASERACERAWMRGCLYARMSGCECVLMHGRSPGDKYLGFFLE